VGRGGREAVGSDLGRRDSAVGTAAAH
jgi:hypothetical protein